MRKKNYKKDFDFKVNHNKDFFREFNYIYKNNTIFKKLAKDNENLIQKSKIIKNQKDYKKLYNDTLEVSYGLDYLGDKVGLFVKKIKNPILESTINKQRVDNQYLGFECGDLYQRKNVSLNKDNKHCYKYFSKFVDALNDKLKRFRWQMSYSFPTEDQIAKFKKTETKKHYLLTKPLFTHTITYNFPYDVKKDNCLCITSDLLWFDINPIIKFTKKLNNLKKISFIDYFFWWAPNDVKYEKIDYYIRVMCKNPDFLDFSHSPYMEYEKEQNSPLIKKLKHLRKSIDKNIKLEFNNVDYQGDGPLNGMPPQEFLRINNII